MDSSIIFLYLPQLFLKSRSFSTSCFYHSTLLGHTILLDTLSQQLNNSIASEPVLTKIAEFMSRYVIKYQPHYSSHSELQKKITDYLSDRGIPCKLISLSNPTPIDIYLKFQAIPEVYLDNQSEEINTAISEVLNHSKPLW